MLKAVQSAFKPVACHRKHPRASLGKATRIIRTSKWFNCLANEKHVGICSSNFAKNPKKAGQSSHLYKHIKKLLRSERIQKHVLSHSASVRYLHFGLYKTGSKTTKQPHACSQRTNGVTSGVFQIHRVPKNESEWCSFCFISL